MTPRAVEVLKGALGPSWEAPHVEGWGAALAVVTDTFRLSPFEADLLLLAALPELDAVWGDAFAALGAPGRRPTLGLALRLLVPNVAQRARAAAGLPDTPVVRAGLVRLGAGDLPRPDRPVRASAAVVAALEGTLPERLEGTGLVRAGRRDAGAAELEARPTLAALVEGLHASLARAGGGAVHVPSPEAQRGRSLAEALAARAGRGVLVVADVPDSPAAIDDVLALSALRGDVVLAEVRADARRIVLPPGADRGWVVWACAPEVHVEAPRSVELRVALPGPPTPPEMAALWARALGAVGATARIDLLANQTRLDPGLLDRVASLAVSIALARRAPAPEHEDVVAALAELRRDPPAAFAQVSRPKVPWTSLLLPPATRQELDELRIRVEHRITVQHRWGMGSASGRGDGLVALLHGESGTGKTYAAEALASALGLPLVRIDLSRVVSKYIGETEKNLAAVFAEAEGFASLLFFDEADAVFGKRTGVRDAHDRYANIETNYLLQRLESFEGVALLATNLLQNLDDAFLRRLAFVVHLPRPTPGVRRALWDTLLPAGVRGPGVDLDALAARFDLVGGEIRNAALSAAYVAAARGEPVDEPRLVDAIRRELAKKGRPLPTPRGDP